MDIEQRIEVTRTELHNNARSGHVLLAGHDTQGPDLPAARIMFIAASLGSNGSDIEALNPVAVGLELLRLGLEKHYDEPLTASGSRNLYIISADYYYAQAINMATAFNRGDIVAHLVKAIADVAEAEVLRRTSADELDSSQHYNEKNAGLYSAAVRLGFLLSGNKDEQAQNVLIKYSALYAMIERFKKAGIENKPIGEYIRSFRDDVLKGLKTLPLRQGEALANLVA